MSVDEEERASRRDIIRQLNYLCSADAERLSDYERINRFIVQAKRALALLEGDQ